MRFNDLEKDGLIIPKNAAIPRLVSRLIVQTATFVFVVACGLQMFELLGELPGVESESPFEVSWFNTFYFTTITIFTVGYGDFVPYSLYGRLWVMCVIIFGAFLVSAGVSEAIGVVSSLRRGMGSFVKSSAVDHIVVTGNIKWAYLRHFVSEFYAERQNAETQIVILSKQATWADDDWDHFMSANPQFKSLLVALEGSTNEPKDLRRCQLDNAIAVFVLCNPHHPDPYLEDSETLQAILAMRSFNATVPIYSICALRDSLFQVTFASEEAKQEEAEDPSDLRVLAGIDEAHLYSGLFPEEVLDEAGNSGETYDTTKRKSRAICMQNVEVALFAENVFCNGLSTLLSNLVFKAIPTTDSRDRPWLIEYKSGAEYHLEIATLPEEFHDRFFSDIAVTLYDHQLVLIAAHLPTDSKWKVARTSTQFSVGMKGLFVTVMEAATLEMALADIAEDLRLLHPRGTRTPPTDFTESIFGRLEEETEEISPILPSDRDSTKRESTETPPQPGGLSGRRSRERSSRLNLRSSGTTGEVSTLRRNVSVEDMEATRVIYRSRSLPAHLRRHIIVCVIGEMSLRNMDYLLQRLWMDRPSHSARCPVVAIHPKFPPDFEERFDKYKGLLFLLNGSSMSIETLKRAQYDTALAIMVMACEDKLDIETADSRAIFTVMTLDHMLGENSSTFVCCTLDAEESLELLRAPARPRRKGTQLGGGFQPMVLYRGTSTGSESAFRGGSSRRPGRPMRWGGLDKSGSLDTDEDAYLGIRRFVGARERTQSLAGRSRTSLATGTREEIFERQRFASGEMMISSLYTSLLIREFVVPGIMDLIQKITGMRLGRKTLLIREFVVPGIMDLIQKITGMRLGRKTQKKKPSWVRLLTIPHSYLQLDDSSDGEVTYRRLFETLVRLGAIPLGLYRSGTAPVRMQVEVTADDEGASAVASATTTTAAAAAAAAVHARKLSASSTASSTSASHRRTGSLDARGGGRRGSGALPRHQRHASIALDGKQRDALRQHGNLTERRYACPTTGLAIKFEEVPGGENVLPYVYTNPEPYSVIAETDAVFAL
eukprot:CAMPEP_0198370448 /NCGR_PEP_ID=MMETSP1450-20131203/156721_1 /TAXON_ID=753684 ORGANISM="Madagascaria erythrocladiodes, Strain CCMP3234" /NCGR_SAMPLE_ID=MMETSP1450 /ASSEMBLY_ACC=CAM_ASM_001115 /LENGTH=1055 /DNA_ID=CAMNT_0044077989 /DNA_START=86 /DNA_END=3249 /DNA_ORIENTATION=-